MKIATHNVNGIQGRLEMPLIWLAETRPDIDCLQELKAPQAQSPERELARAGYEAVCHGQISGAAMMKTVPGTPNGCKTV